MKHSQALNITNHFFLFTTMIIISVGALGIFRELILYISIINSTLAIGFALLLNGEVKFPKNFIWYVLFLLATSIHNFVFKGNLFFLMLFVSGGMMWLQIFNYKDIFLEYFSKLLIALGILMAILYVYSSYQSIELPNLVSLFAPATSYIKHSNIGDFWSIIMVSLFVGYVSKKSIINLPIFIFGLVFVIISLSRDAILTFLTGSYFAYTKLQPNKNLGKIIKFLLIVLGLSFIIVSTQKSVLFSRPYFAQALFGLSKYPLGTGLGNFSKVSNETNLVHNLPLEIVSATGVFSIFFLVWLVKNIKNVLRGKNLNIEYSALFIAILVNFLFNTTYMIPAMFWIWFIALALI